ncbi:MAG TPA: helix-turn-helix transcriptional regulator [Deltaproteobacteria bacterium]|nr:helix-turn-helix transcriptional regulator [Deltaproteobacteria bacterium]HPR53103.1 helix-turn-helix transcriptional regulator [Deltaproteobacteria bacterium]
MEPKDILLSIRKELELTQDELAEILFVSKQTIWRWEAGESRVPPLALRTLIDLAKNIDEDKRKNLSILKEELPEPAKTLPGKAYHAFWASRHLDKALRMLKEAFNELQKAQNDIYAVPDGVFGMPWGSEPEGIKRALPILAKALWYLDEASRRDLRIEDIMYERFKKGLISEEDMASLKEEFEKQK